MWGMPLKSSDIYERTISSAETWWHAKPNKKQHYRYSYLQFDSGSGEWGWQSNRSIGQESRRKKTDSKDGTKGNHKYISQFPKTLETTDEDNYRSIKAVYTWQDERAGCWVSWSCNIWEYEWNQDTKSTKNTEIRQQLARSPAVRKPVLTFDNSEALAATSSFGSVAISGRGETGRFVAFKSTRRCHDSCPFFLYGRASGPNSNFYFSFFLLLLLEILTFITWYWDFLSRNFDFHNWKFRLLTRDFELWKLISSRTFWICTRFYGLGTNTWSFAGCQVMLVFWAMNCNGTIHGKTSWKINFIQCSQHYNVGHCPIEGNDTRNFLPAYWLAFLKNRFLMSGTLIFGYKTNKNRF